MGSMDADVMITVAFCLEVFLFGFAAAVFIVREARKGRAETAPACANISASTVGPPVTAPESARARPAAREIHS
jgi:hypothetical protein